MTVGFVPESFKGFLVSCDAVLDSLLKELFTYQLRPAASPFSRLSLALKTENGLKSHSGFAIINSLLISMLELVCSPHGCLNNPCGDETGHLVSPFSGSHTSSYLTRLGDERVGGHQVRAAVCVARAEPNLHTLLCVCCDRWP